MIKNKNFLSRLFVLFCWIFFIFVALTTPVYKIVSPGVNSLDKVWHFFLFGILAFLFVFTFLSLKKINLKICIFLSLIFSLLYNLFCEFLQKFVPGRFPSFGDFLAGSLGVFLFLILTFIIYKENKENVLLHICCAGCGAYVAKVLGEEFRVTLFYSNSNIFPESEYAQRIKEVERVARKYNLNLVKDEYNHTAWLKKMKGLEGEPEKGARCLLCYEDRLEAAAKMAQERRFKYFASTLSVSPHKVAEKINAIGIKLSKKYNIEFLNRDFKKNNGFIKSVQLSKELELYRQNYCGCEFSKK